MINYLMNKFVFFFILGNLNILIGFEMSLDPENYLLIFKLERHMWRELHQS